VERLISVKAQVLNPGTSEAQDHFSVPLFTKNRANLASLELLQEQA